MYVRCCVDRWLVGDEAAVSAGSVSVDRRSVGRSVGRSDGRTDGLFGPSNELLLVVTEMTLTESAFGTKWCPNQWADRLQLSKQQVSK